MNTPAKISNLSETDKNAFRNLGVGVKVVSDLPDLINSGVLILYKGEFWRGLEAGESILPEGTPWPVKGYKELKFSIRQNDTDAPVIHISCDNFDCETPISFVRRGIGSYDCDVTQLNATEPFIYWNILVSQSVFDEWGGSQKYIGAYWEPQTHNLKVFTYYQDFLNEGGMADSILRDDCGLFISLQQFLPQSFNPGTFPPGPQ